MTVRFILSLSLLLCLSSAQELKLTPKEELYLLKSSIDRTIQQVDPNVNLGIAVISLKNGQILYERNAKNLFVPASTQKMFTAAAALFFFGPDYRFETVLYRDKEIKQDALQGDLFLKGSGDPSLITADLDELTAQLVSAGIKRINGDLVIDNFDFDALTQGPGWMWDEGAEYWNSPLDALLVNHSSINVTVQPGQQMSAPPTVSIEPCIEGVTIHNKAETSQKEENLQVMRKWMTRENLIDVEGSISPQSTPVSYRIPIESPALYTATLLRDRLAQQGIQLKGEIRYHKIPPQAICLAIHKSAPLKELIYPVLKDSDNLYANCFFKKMGQILYYTPGTWQKGARAVRSFLEERVGLPAASYAILDGDGESRYNLCSPLQLVSFLKWMKEKFPYFAEFKAALPISGTDGSLKGRLTGAEVKGKICAKTGGMTGITSLAGYAETQQGDLLAFAIMINGFVKPAEDYRKNIEDAISVLLTQFAVN